MFTKVHHVTYVVESIDQMAEYMEKNFGLKPARTDEIGDRGYKSILYHIGPTMVDFFDEVFTGGWDTAEPRRQFIADAAIPFGFGA